MIGKGIMEELEESVFFESLDPDGIVGRYVEEVPTISVDAHGGERKSLRVGSSRSFRDVLAVHSFHEKTRSVRQGDAAGYGQESLSEAIGEGIELRHEVRKPCFVVDLFIEVSSPAS